MDCFGVLAGSSGPSCADFGSGRRADTDPGSSDPGRGTGTNAGRRANLNPDPHPAAQVP